MTWQQYYTNLAQLAQRYADVEDAEMVRALTLLMQEVRVFAQGNVWHWTDYFRPGSGFQLGVLDPETGKIVVEYEEPPEIARAITFNPLDTEGK